jgi:hypothetical protein
LYIYSSIEKSRKLVPAVLAIKRPALPVVKVEPPEVLNAITSAFTKERMLIKLDTELTVPPSSTIRVEKDIVGVARIVTGVFTAKDVTVLFAEEPIAIFVPLLFADSRQ